MITKLGLPAALLLSLGACGNSGGGGGDTIIDASTEEAAPTWYGGVEALLVGSCGSCHTAGGIGPFPLDSYDSAKSAGPAAVDATHTGRMPPWLAQDTDECAPPLPWQDDIRLSDADKKMLADWVEAGSPLGDPADALALPTPPSLSLENPSHEMAWQQPFAVSGENDIFECFVLNPNVSEDTWITGVQIEAGNAKVNHHALVFLDPNGESDAMATDGHFPCFSNPDLSDGSLIGVWAPGAQPFRIPETGGVPMKAGARIVVQMHYHPTISGVEMDSSKVTLETTNVRPTYDAILGLIGNFDKLEDDGSGLQPGMNDNNGVEFVIPAGEANHVENLIYRQEFPIKIPIFGVGAHMHYVGTSMKIDLKKANGEDSCLLHTPKWDFDWQRSYNYDAAIEDLPYMEMGDELHLRCIYNNTMANPAVADAVTERGLTQPVEVRLGEETLDEMCLGVFGALVPSGLL